MDKISNSILGFVIGDALGVPVEFVSRSNLKSNPVVGMRSYGSHSVPKGTWSDDTSMMLATMDSLIENNCVNYDDIMEKFNNWFKYAYYTATNEVFDIGITTRKALIDYELGVSPLKCGLNSYYDNGNGSLMRILPVVIYSFKNNLNFEKDMEIINNVSSLTHAHEISKLGCKIFSDYVKNLLSGQDKVTSLYNLSMNNYDKYYSRDSLKLYSNILRGNIMNFQEENIKSSGFVVDTLEAAIWVNLKSDSFKDAVLKAVNLGDDTDTIGAITGSIAGLIYNNVNIPLEWIDELQNKEYLFNLIADFEKNLTKESVNSFGKI